MKKPTITAAVIAMAVLLGLTISGCASSGGYDGTPSADGSSWPAKLATAKPLLPPAFTLVDSRPPEQTVFQEKPSATGAFATLGDLAVSPAPVVYLTERLATERNTELKGKEIVLTRFTTEVTYRTKSPTGAGAGSGHSMPFVPTNLMELTAAITLASIQRYTSQNAGPDGYSAVEVAVVLKIDGRFVHTKVTVPFDRRLEGLDVANAVRLAVDNISRDLKAP